MPSNFKAAKVNYISLRSSNIDCLHKIILNVLLENINMTVTLSVCIYVVSLLCLLCWHIWHKPMYMYIPAHDHLMECLCLTLKSFLLCFGPYAFCQNLNYYAPGFEGTCQLYVSSYEFFDCEVCIIPVGALYLMPFNVYYTSGGIIFDAFYCLLYQWGDYIWCLLLSIIPA